MAALSRAGWRSQASPDERWRWHIRGFKIDVLRFQQALTRTLRRVSNEDREGSPGRWFAQYVGFLRNGHKVVYVNAVGDGPIEADWRQHAVTICDGGLMSFGAVLDLERDTVDSFAFNGTLGGSIRLSDVEAVDAPSLKAVFIGQISQGP